MEDSRRVALDVLEACLDRGQPLDDALARPPGFPALRGPWGGWIGGASGPGAAAPIQGVGGRGGGAGWGGGAWRWGAPAPPPASTRRCGCGTAGWRPTTRRRPAPSPPRT